MANPPREPGLPPLNRTQRILLPLVDAFMVAMLSRPSSGSLRTTRVTTVSIVLAAAAFILFGAVGAVVGLGAGSQVFRWLAVVLLEAFALSSGALALFGLLQRRVSG